MRRAGLCAGYAGLLLHVACAVLLCLPSRALGAPSEPDARALARKRLVEQAQEVVRQSAFGSLASARENIETLRASIRADWASSPDPEQPPASRLAWLLALGDATPDPARPGALLEAVWYGHWLAGKEPGGRYALQAPGGEGKTPELRLYDEAEWKALTAEERSPLLRDSVLDLARVRADGRVFEGSLDFRPASPDEAATEGVPQGTDPVAGLRAPPGALKRGLVHDGELADEISEMWLRAREAQVREHLEAWGKERSAQLLTEEEMARHTRRVDAIQEERARIRQREAAVLAGLDRMVGREMDVNRRIFQLEGQLEAAKAVAGAKEAQDAARPDSVRLRLQQTLAKLERLLLHVTVVRAQHRLALYERALELTAQESVVAETARDRLRQRVRRERRIQELDYLAHDRGWFQANRQQVLEAAAKAGEAEQEARKAYVGILDDMETLGDLLTKLVRLRQALGTRVRIDEGEGESPAPGTEPAAAAPAARFAGDSQPPAAKGAPGSLANPPGEAESAPDTDTDAARRQSLGPLLHPEQFVHRADFISAVRTALPDPTFDAGLVARTYRAVNDYIAERNRSLSASSAAEGVEREYEALAATLPARLKAVASGLPGYMAWDLEEVQAKRRPYAELRERTMTGVRDERALARRQIADLEALRRELMGLGRRSLDIRVDRSLDAAGLRSGADDVLEAGQGVFSWLSFGREPHLGTFLASHWKQMAAALLLAVLLALGIRLGRRRIDRALQRIGVLTPTLLPQDLTVGTEAAEAKQALQRERVATEDAEAEAIRCTAAEDVPLQSPEAVADPEVQTAKDAERGGTQ